MNNKTLEIIYWASTALVIFVCLYSGIQNIRLTEEVKMLNAQHGFNILLIPFLGILKILGAAAISIPYFKQFKDPAYHGLIFYFIGATYINIIDDSKSYITTILILVFIIISFWASKKAVYKKQAKL